MANLQLLILQGNLTHLIETVMLEERAQSVHSVDIIAPFVICDYHHNCCTMCKHVAAYNMLLDKAFRDSEPPLPLKTKALTQLPC